MSSVSISIGSCSGSIGCSGSGSKLWKDADSVVPVPGLDGGLENGFVELLPTRGTGSVSIVLVSLVVYCSSKNTVVVLRQGPL